MNDGISPTPGWARLSELQIRKLMQVAHAWAGPDANDSRSDDLEMALRAIRIQFSVSATPLQAEMQKSDQAHFAAPQTEAKSLQPLLDAERYRWLREKAVWANGIGDDSPMVWCVIGTSALKCWPCDGEELDEAIDAALRASSAPTTKG